MTSMQMRRARVAAVMATTLACVMFSTINVLAQGGLGDPPKPDPGIPTSSDISVTSGPGGITVHIAVSQATPGAAGNGSADTNSASVGRQPSCSADLMNIGSSASTWLKEEAPTHPGQSPWTVTCDDGFFSIVWLPRDAAASGGVTVVAGTAGVDPTVVAMDLLDRLPIPGIEVHANPAPGLVALPSWFWIGGYAGTPIGASDTLGGTTVDVQVEPTTYHWDFGDGATLDTSSLGQPYPAESDIQHTYEQAADGVTVTVDIDFTADFRVDGGTWQPLSPITRSFMLTYPVRQVQSVLTGGQS